MRIAISGMFWRQPMVGSGQYLHGLLHALAHAAPQHEYHLLLPGYSTTSAAAALPPNVNATIVAGPLDGQGENWAKLWFEQIGVPAAAARLRADLLHVPYAAAPLRSSVPVITTVHDIIWLVLPEYRGSSAAQAYFRLVASATRRAAHILADSEHTRNDIVRVLGCSPAQVSTVLLAVDPQFHPPATHTAKTLVAEHYDLHGPYIYNVSGMDVRKNTPLLIRAFGRMLRAGGPEATLVIAGRAPGNDPVLFPDLDGLIAQLGLHGAVRRVEVPRGDNPALYAAATVFAFPSRYEGFGLPPLEAMTCGTPVLAADASSLPEVTGDAALLISPDDEAGWAAALWRVLADEPLRQRMRARGLQRASQFSYQRTARDTLDIYARVAAQR